MTALTLSGTGLPTKRIGGGNWLRAYRAMVIWEVLGSRLFFVLVVLVQVIIGAGFVIGFGLLIPDLSGAMALYLSTGGIVMSLITMGLIVTPQMVAQRKMEGSYEYVWSLPVPRSAATMASLTLSSLAAIPGVVAALAVAVWRYHVSFSIHWTVVPAVVLTLAAGVLLGSAFAHGLDNPQVTLMITQLLIFGVMGFSPISFPIDRLPGWLATVHQYLPLHHMALAVRSSLTDGLVVMTGRSWLILSLWTIAAGVITGIVLERRR
jgi:ABC-2 type transport system permease protein